MIFLDPMLPLGAIGPRLQSAPYVVVAHGAEITVPASTPGSAPTRPPGHARARPRSSPRADTRRARRHASPAATSPASSFLRESTANASGRAPTRSGRQSRLRFGLDPDRPLVLGLSRLVPRKGFDVVIDAVAEMPGRAARDRRRRAATAPDWNGARSAGGADVRLPRPGRRTTISRALYGCADAFAMCCRDRWGGLEAEGFGIVFLEAAACGGACGRRSQRWCARSGRRRRDRIRRRAARRSARFAAALDILCRRRRTSGPRMGRAARERAVGEYSYDSLVARLLPMTRGDFSAAETLPR